ncbi:cobalt ABC transporter permease [Virgisporangium aurantiacum]|uniref:Cobalt ABC transporter permease n=1 Tax=Virgisporangium aurantiacum TaxID=175570 RepID=A0A8J3YWC9_9ACTN|nr:energy-coupling factor transporter transmembrane protein EcfT [Virgisporangium aurantiacum]GIJ52874.1 cobalt ABC transporter permease [Virgisporangium aurantiacum]
MILPRTLHPGAWWIWALGLATAASRTTNPVLLALIVAAASFVVARRRGDAPWALAFRLYLWLGALIVASRLLFRVIFGGGGGTHVLFTLPEIPLPEFAAGIRLFGPVAAEELLSGLYDGMRLAAMVVCVGAANALANPKRLLKLVPAALYEAGTAIVVALSVAPQLAESVLRVRRARRLRGGTGAGVRALRAILLPVLADALDRSLTLAAALDSRGYARAGTTPFRVRLASGTLVVGGLIGVCVGVYGLLDGTTPRALGSPMLFAGAAAAVTGMLLGGRRIGRTRYRPDRWGTPETVTALCGVGTGALLFATVSLDPGNLYPSLSPLTWPALAPLPAAAITLAALPGVVTPPPVPS